MNLVTTKALVAILFALVRFICGTLPIQIYAFLKYWHKEEVEGAAFINDKRLRQVNCNLALLQSFSGGVLFATCFLHMMPGVYECVIELRKYGDIVTKFPYSQLIISVGFFVVYFIEEISYWLLNITNEEFCPKKVFKNSATISPQIISRLPSRTNGFLIERKLSNQAKEFYLEERKPPPVMFIEEQLPNCVNVFNEEDVEYNNHKNGFSSDKNEFGSDKNDSDKNELDCDKNGFGDDKNGFVGDKNGYGGDRNGIGEDKSGLRTISGYLEEDKKPPSRRSFMITNHDEDEEMDIPHLTEENEMEEPIKELEKIIDFSNKTRHQILRCILIVLAISSHAVIEGLAIGLQKSTSDIWYLFTAVSIHSAAILFTISLELLIAHARIRTILVQVFLLSITSPLGVLTGLIITLTTDMNTHAKSVAIVFLEGFSTGAILYITFFEVLKKEKERRVYTLQRAIFIMSGFILMAVLEYAEVYH